MTHARMGAANRLDITNTTFIGSEPLSSRYIRNILETIELYIYIYKYIIYLNHVVHNNFRDDDTFVVHGRDTFIPSNSCQESSYSSYDKHIKEESATTTTTAAIPVLQ